MIVDLKNSFLPVLIGARYRTPFRRPGARVHAKDVYLAIIKRLAPQTAQKQCNFQLSSDEIRTWESLRLGPSIFIACASRSSQKTYPYHLLKEVISKLSGETRIVLLGQVNDRAYYQDIADIQGVIDLIGKTMLYDVAYLLAHYARMLIAVDSSIMQLASYLNIPILALFGPTDPVRYGPWSKHFRLVQNNNLSCMPCEQANCVLSHQCMEISPTVILDGVKALTQKYENQL